MGKGLERPQCLCVCEIEVAIDWCSQDREEARQKLIEETQCAVKGLGECEGDAWGHGCGGRGWHRSCHADAVGSRLGEIDSGHGHELVDVVGCELGKIYGGGKWKRRGSAQRTRGSGLMKEVGGDTEGRESVQLALREGEEIEELRGKTVVQTQCSTRKGSGLVPLWAH